MSYLRRMDIRAADSASIDAFSRWRVSNPDTVFDSTFLYDLQPLIYEQLGTGGGAVSHSPNDSSAVLALTGDVNGSIILQSKEYHQYIPGKSQLIIMTGCMLNAVGGVVKRVGYFDANNGIFYELDEWIPAFVVRSNVSGSVVDNRVVQSAWNLDPLDGTGPSAKVLDATKAYILVIDLQWLGMGRVRCGFDIDGVIVYVHEFLHANTLATVYMRTGTLPTRWEMFSVAVSPTPSGSSSPSASASPSSSLSASPSPASASTSPSASVSVSPSASRSPSRSASPSASPSATASASPSLSPSPSTEPTFATMLATCCSVQSEGGSDRHFSYSFSYRRASLSAGNGVQTYAFSIRPKLLFNGITNRIKIRPRSFEIAITGNNAVLVEIYYGGVVAGAAAWTSLNATYSALEVDTAGTPSGGFVIDSFLANATATAKEAKSETFFGRYPLVLDINGLSADGNLITVYVTGSGGASACVPGLTWEEIR